MEITLRIVAYTLTSQDFSYYSVAMDEELTALEERIRQAVALCISLRDENRGLRIQLAALENDKRMMAERMEGARDRLESLMKQIPG